MKKITTLLFLAVILLLTQACDRPECTNQNPTFDQYDMESAEYKAELVSQLSKINNEDLRIWLKAYSKEDGQEYLTIYIQNDDLCAQTKMLVYDWSRMGGVQAKEGVGYRGAEILGLQWQIQQNNASPTLVYTRHDHMLD